MLLVPSWAKSNTCFKNGLTFLELRTLYIKFILAYKFRQHLDEEGPYVPYTMDCYIYISFEEKT